jgi:uncharacterized protein YciI
MFISIPLRMETVMRKYVALIGHGPSWLEGRSVYEQGKPIEDHLVAMRGQYDAGILQLGGPFDHGGGIAVLDVRDEAAARAVMDADPAVQAGVMVYELRALRPVFDAAGDIRSDGPVDTIDDSGRVDARAEK